MIVNTDDLKLRELIARAKEGDENSFVELLKCIYPELWRLCFKLTQNRVDGEDILQETVCRIYKYLKNYDMKYSFRNWYYAITLNCFKSFKMKESKMKTMPINSEAIVTSLESRTKDDIDCAIKLELIKDGIKLLTRKERMVFTLRDIDEMDIAKISSLLKMSQSTCRVHLSNARRKIKDFVYRKLKKDRGDIYEL